MLSCGSRALANPLSFSDFIAGIGRIQIEVETDATGNEALTGGFTAADGKTLAQLESQLGEDHLNWFQKVTSAPEGKHVDPPPGGFDQQWADDVPWYWDEVFPTTCPPLKVCDSSLQLSKQIRDSGTTLHFEDAPSDVPGTTLSFATFLISDYGNHTYLPIGVDFGFSWTAVVRPDGTTAITSLDPRATFTDEYKLEISEDFPGNYKTVIPEPATYLLLSTGAVFLRFCSSSRRSKVVNDETKRLALRDAARLKTAATSPF